MEPASWQDSLSVLSKVSPAVLYHRLTALKGSDSLYLLRKWQNEFKAGNYRGWTTSEKATQNFKNSPELGGIQQATTKLITAIIMALFFFSTQAVQQAIFWGVGGGPKRFQAFCVCTPPEGIPKHSLYLLQKLEITDTVAIILIWCQSNPPESQTMTIHTGETKHKQQLLKLRRLKRQLTSHCFLQWHSSYRRTAPPTPHPLPSDCLLCPAEVGEERQRHTGNRW